jgi:anthranilate phosphoribosyltransferase
MPGMDADHILAAARRTEGLYEAEATAALDAILAGTLSHEQGAELLVALRTRGETPCELAAWVRGLLARAARIDPGRAVCDIVGTGGSGRARYNASTTAAFVLAAAGIPVAKHGNKGSSRPNGSFDLLDALELPYQLPPAAHRQLLDDTGVCFLFARSMHPAVAAAAPMRKLAAQRVHGTIFNLAGPLANPARPRRALIGSALPRQAAVVAAAAHILGSERTLVACGHPGLDEVSVTGPTRLWEVDRDGVRDREMPCPTAVADEAAVMGGDAADNARTFLHLLSGDGTGPLADFVCANAAAAAAAWEGGDPADPHRLAAMRAHLASGRARTAFERHRSAARRLAGLP